MKTLNDLLGDEGAATVLRQRCEELTQDKLSLLKKVRDMGAEIETLKAGRESLRSERDMAHERGSEMDKMREWNRLCELELANLRMLNEGLTSELEHLKGSAYTSARAYRDKEFHAVETVLAATEKELAECNRVAAAALEENAQLRAACQQLIERGIVLPFSNQGSAEFAMAIVDAKAVLAEEKARDDKAYGALMRGETHL